jgi:hypothetical protein
MNTPQTDDIARGNHVVPTEWAQQLERERNEARRLLGYKMGDTPETDFVNQSNDCNALGYGLMMFHARKLERERDEAREAFVIATDQMVIAQGKVREANKERDEAREEVRLLKAILDLIKKDAFCLSQLSDCIEDDTQ